MVSVVQLRPQDALIERALAFAQPLYEGQVLSTGEPVWPHALGLAASLSSIGVDPAAQAAGVLFAVPKLLEDPERLKAEFGEEIAGLAGGVEKLYKLRVLTRASAVEQNEILRKMVLGMVEDIRVVLIRLASRTQTLRWFAKNPSEERKAYARESLDIYSPLANRLGVWQLKWELEDLSFRYLEPELYKKIAQMLDQKRVERERYIASAIEVLGGELKKISLQAEVTGRPKHIYSIWNKMRLKQLDFSDVHDVRALRVIVPTAGDCYSVLGVVHDLWEPIPKEFDDYISRPKGNNYQSLHTAVIGPGGRTLEVQIRTEEMHRQAEFGVAAHWRYKESRKASKAHAPARSDVAFDNKIAWLRELLAWRDEVADGTGGAGWAEKTRKASLDDTIYVITPQGKVVDLPAGATPVDFAYTLHTDLGHRCRGARVDGQLVKLDHPLQSGQRVEIIAAKGGGPTGVGPSRDWLQPELGFLKSHRARGKVRQWFNARQLAETVAQGRAIVEKEQRREGAMQANLEQLAQKLGFAKHDELFAAVARDEVNLRQLQAALRELGGLVVPERIESQPKKVKARSTAEKGILIVGVDRLMTQLAKCCKPVPPDPVRGFVTRGKGVTVHREDCSSLKRLAERSPERLIDTQWGARADGAYPVDILVTASDRQGLLRDIGEALARERINVTAVRTQSRSDLAHMRFSFEVADVAHLRRAFAAVKQVSGVIRVGAGLMEELLNNPAVQGGVAPFLVALVVAFALFSVRLAGLAVVAALGTAVYLIGGAAFPPVSAQQKILLIALAVPVVGVIVDLAFKPTRAAGAVLGLIFGLLVLWVGWNVLKQKETAAMLAAGAGVAALVAWLTGAMFSLRDDPVRAGAAAMSLGLGVGISAVLSASGSYGQYGASVGAGAGAFLLVQMLLGRTLHAGATFTLSAGVACGLLAAGATLGAQLPWYAAAVLALVPVATLLPLPKGGVWMQAVVASIYGGIAAAAACLLSWSEVQQRLGL